MLTRAAGAIGVVLLAGAWAGPWAADATRSFVAHMSAHMIVVAGAAPLLAFAAAGSRVVTAGIGPWLAPVPASLAELVAVWLWHTPVLHQAARHHTAMFVAEQASFLAAGMAFWLAVWRAAVADRGRAAGSAVVALLLTLAHMTLLGALIALGPRPLFAPGGGVAALADQQQGGAVMLVGSALVYVAAGVLVTARLLRPLPPAAERWP